MSMMIPTRLPAGSTAWVDLEVRDFTERLTELDDRLALVKEPGERWSIYRVPEDGSPAKHILRSKPGAKLGPHVIELLRRGDTRNGATPIEDIIRHNTLVEKHRQDAKEEAAAVAFDRLMSKVWRGHVPSNVEDLDL